MNYSKYNAPDILRILKEEIEKKGRFLTINEIYNNSRLPSAKVVKKIFNQSSAELYNSLPLNITSPLCSHCKSASTSFITTRKSGYGQYKCKECGKNFVYPYPDLPRCVHCGSSNTRSGGFIDKERNIKYYKCVDCNRRFQTIPHRSISKDYFIRLDAWNETTNISVLLADSLELTEESYIQVVEDEGEIIIIKSKHDDGFKVSRIHKNYGYIVTSTVLCRYLKDKLRLEEEYNVNIRTNQEGRIMEIISKREIRKKYERRKYRDERFISIRKNGSIRMSIALIREMGIEPDDQLIIIQHESKYYLSLATVSEIKNDLGFNVYMDAKFRSNVISSNISLAKYLMEQFDMDDATSFRVFTSGLTEIKGRKVILLDKAVQRM